MSLDFDCPACNKSMLGMAHSSGVPDMAPCTGDPGLCVHCGTLLRWSGDGWSVMTDEQRATVMQDPTVVNALVMQREFLAWQEADRERLRTVCRYWLTAMAKAQTSAPTVIEQFTETMVDRMIDAGFHTHKLAGQP